MAADPDAATERLVHYHPPPTACGLDLLAAGELWTGNADRVTCRDCVEAAARDRERRSCPLCGGRLNDTDKDTAGYWCVTCHVYYWSPSLLEGDPS